MKMKIQFETEKDIDLILEPWGHIEAIKENQKVLLEYLMMYDTEGHELWPLVSIGSGNSILVDLPSLSLRGYIDEKLFYECWD